MPDQTPGLAEAGRRGFRRAPQWDVWTWKPWICRAFGHASSRRQSPDQTLAVPAPPTTQRNVPVRLRPAGSRVRCYGLLGNWYRKAKLDECRRLLGIPTPVEPDDPNDGDYRDRYEELTDGSLYQCPQRNQGRMMIIEVLSRMPCNSTRTMGIEWSGWCPKIAGLESPIHF